MDINKEERELSQEPPQVEVPKWHQGTGRDLFDDTRHVAAFSLGRAESPTAGDVGDERAAMALEIAEGDRFDGRDAGLRDFRLDPVSEAAAIRVGEQLASEVPLSAWRTADLADRTRMCDDIYRTLSSEIAPNADAPLPDFTLSASEAGWSSDGEVHYNIHNLEDPTAQDAIETLAHEYRHVWQDDVISGVQAHPGGEAARGELQAGLEAYDANDVREVSYTGNVLEVDAEKFARLVYAEYVRRS